MNNVKPIFIVGLPSTRSVSNKVGEVEEMLSEKMPDYHVLVYLHGEDEIRFKCFYEKDFEEINFEDLKKYIMDRVNTKK